MTIIVGIGGFFHDFNAAAIKIADNLDAPLVVTGEEERFSRKKHHSIMGAKSTSYDCIKYCLSKIEASFEQVDYVVLSDKEVHPLKSFLVTLFPNAEFHHVGHHLCHAAAAFYSSGYNDAAILCLDGFGDNKSGLLAYGNKNEIQPIKYIELENSIGLEYLRVTFQIGLGSFGSEGKTQGLAAYGTPRFFSDYMNEIELTDDGGFLLSEQLKNMEGYLEGEHYIEEKSLFNDFILDRINRRFKQDPLEQEHIDMAASIQKVLDTIGLHSSATLKSATKTSKLVTTGGVALNSTMNGKLLESNLFEEVYAHPSASDRGNALGAALYFITNTMHIDTPLKEPIIYGGQEFSNEEIENNLKDSGISGEKLDDPCQVGAELIADSKILGWFQGRSELGARALGNRSILADPRAAENKDILNLKVKHREYFRPFAPSVLSERTKDYFVTNVDLPYMTMTVKVVDDKKSVIPAVTHQDDTARVQSVSSANNLLYYSLISKFNEITGVPVVINTSFNDSGEPIVETPKDAIQCFLKTGMDALIMGNWLITK